jgi:hypothetical protein
MNECLERFFGDDDAFVPLPALERAFANIELKLAEPVHLIRHSGRRRNQKGIRNS